MTPLVRVRAAVRGDVASMHGLRMAVRENRLSDPARIGEDDYLQFIDRASAWVAEMEDRIVGFAAIDEAGATVWALFVDPEAEGLGVGSALHDFMIRWACDRRIAYLSLTTSPGTRAEYFYRSHGWSTTGATEVGEVRFERRL